MARIKPFRGIRYNPEKVKYDAVVTQPYDKISPDLQEKYYSQSEYTTAKLIKNKSDSPYQEAADFFKKWLQEGVLLQDDRPSLYAYYQKYKVNGQPKIRKGFVAMVGLEEYSKKIILPHERTLSKPKADRLNLLRATHANLEQIFLLYADPDKKINKLLEFYSAEEPTVKADDHFGDTHLLWQIDNPEVITEVINFMSDQQLFIADGHHRYETACNFARENGVALGQDHPCGYCLATLINMEDEGLTVLPTHRLLHSLPDFNEQELLKKCAEYFKISEAKDLQACLKTMSEISGKNAYGFYAGNKYYTLELSHQEVMEKLIGKEHSADWKKLDVAVLHTVILEKILSISKEKQAAEENINYIRTADKGVEQVTKKQKQAIFLLNPTGVHQVRDVALAGDVMPQKSTDFYPKLLSGMVFARLEK